MCRRLATAEHAVDVRRLRHALRLLPLQPLLQRLRVRCGFVQPLLHDGVA